MISTKTVIAFFLLAMCPATFGQAGRAPAVEDRDTAVVTFEDVEYLRPALNAHIQGTVVVQVRFDDRGKVLNADAISGPWELIQTSLDNVKKWTFKPNNSKTAVIVYNYKILDGRCNRNSSLFILEGKNVATILACPPVANPSAPTD